MGKGLFSLSESEDRSIRISYEDYGIGGYSSYETIYTLDPENREKLEAQLRTEAAGTLKEMITEVFGEYLDKKGFDTYCEEHEITYERFIWTEGDWD